MVDGRWTGAWAEVDADSSGLPPSALLPGPRRGRKPGIVPGGVSPYERVGPPPVGHRVFDMHTSCRWADL